MPDMTTAEFDHAHARVRDEVDALVDGLVLGHKTCTCGHAITSQHHVGYIATMILQRYHPGTLPLLLAEAATRLAIARGAK